MSELCDSKIRIFTLLFSDLVLFCSVILSHPLYFSYFVFFLPYILKLVSFIYPLFITIFLVLFAVLTGLVHDGFSTEFGQSWVGYLQIACGSVLERLQSEKEVENGGFGCLEDLEMYKIVFGPSVMGVEGNQVEVMEEKSGEYPLQGLQSSVKEDSFDGDLNLNKCELFTADKVKESSAVGAKIEEKRMESFLKLLDEFERMSPRVDDKKVEPRVNKETEKIGEKQIALSSPQGNAYQAAVDKINVTNTKWRKEHTPKVKAHSQRLNFNDDYTNENGVENSPTMGSNVGTYGSMRKEKEWRRTLACMLFEERHNVDGGEGMDSLWETYETDSTNPESSKKKNDKKKSGFESDEECDYEDEMEGNLCCLQAIKLSAGKMNLGVGKPNLVKFSKAVKGFGWLHRVGKKNKKVHNSGDRY
ncbi:uncharacterized protein [Primulina eburnea]|uniref:uncharacterized protein n=1 Tax=Primulina eburnea TaxID=1245227 RepID=UPI003C6C5623